ncbi:peptide-methionine (S)-S-oxide reductase MsrA [Lactovum miscens]|uniref:Peptide methionine sulfoxide reductase MsrA n=1 Tax=Lactovum miscens TaxID=190387 RepID=A0A841C4T7_9LACT|nr:peptide-methionine (S)-S-oxide reductase MsrA [Lactovum miscens]MBB5887277.1 peptide-methionine (S)-S-oxide reductase [Lactovum miscens]
MNEKAIFAGGCFWCMVEPFETRPGIISVLSGFTGGDKEFPTYDEVSGHWTGHVEAVQIEFDNEIVSYSDLLELYWQLIDPTDANGQFYDRGDSYRPVIFVSSSEQAALAEKSKKALQASGRFGTLEIIVPIKEATTFWPAEEYHQDFYKKNPVRYAAVHKIREKFAKKVWPEFNKKSKSLFWKK